MYECRGCTNPPYEKSQFCDLGVYNSFLNSSTADSVGVISILIPFPHEAAMVEWMQA